jgi:hypothetical protein
MLNISVGGDPDGGYLVDIHDGGRHDVYRPVGHGSDVDVLAAALKEHDTDLYDRLGNAISSREMEAAQAAVADVAAAARDSKALQETAEQERDAAVKRADGAEKELADLKAKMPQAPTAIPAGTIIAVPFDEIADGKRQAHVPGVTAKAADA